MKRTIITIVSILALGAGALLAPLTAATPAYADAKSQVTQGFTDVGGTGKENLTVSVGNIINVILYALGAIAVIMIIIGGFRYVLSAGDSSSITAAKNTIFYAVIGLVVAILAFAIVNFVLKSVK